MNNLDIKIERFKTSYKNYLEVKKQYNRNIVSELLGFLSLILGVGVIIYIIFLLNVITVWYSLGMFAAVFIVSFCLFLVRVVERMIPIKKTKKIHESSLIFLNKSLKRDIEELNKLKTGA